MSDLLFVGRATTCKLVERNVLTIGDIAKTPIDYLISWFGKNGIMLSRFANGEDTSRIMPNGYEAPVKSVGHGITCDCDLHTEQEVWKVMLELSQDIGHRLRQYGLAAQGIRLAIRFSGLGGQQYQAQLPYPTQSPMEIAQAVRILFMKRYSWNEAVRAITISAINLIPEGFPLQLDLFGDENARMRRKQLEDCIDQLRGRFGKRAIYSAALMGDLHMPGDGRHEVTMPSMMYT